MKINILLFLIALFFSNISNAKSHSHHNSHHSSSIHRSKAAGYRTHARRSEREYHKDHKLQDKTEQLRYESKARNEDRKAREINNQHARQNRTIAL